MRREREVLLLYGAAFRNIPHAANLESHVPRLSSDSTLTALCQLTAIRMGTQRSMVSLLDDDRQHVLAEATCDLPIRPEAPGDASETLWLGNISIPRSWGSCEKILDLDPNEEPVFIIKDVTADPGLCSRELFQSNSDMGFYASVPLSSPNGVIVGSLCIFDSKTRRGLSKEQISLFKDLGSTVVDYLSTYTVRDQYTRGERFTRGLVSFTEGNSALEPLQGDTPHGSPTPSQTPTDLSFITDKHTGSTDEWRDVREDVVSRLTNPTHPQSAIVKRERTRSARHRAIRTLQDSILPNDSKSMFSRAASVMMSSSDLDGVLILDASVAANGGQCRASSVSGGDTEAHSESSQSRYSSDDASSNSTEGYPHGASSPSSKMCQLLGVATSSNEDNPEHGPLLESDLSRLFHEYPNGKIFTFNADSFASSSTAEPSPSPKVTGRPSPFTPSNRKTNARTRRGSTAIQAMFPKACSVAFIPFWDFERSRWFAGCLCWSNDPYRLLSASVDLAYFKVFSHSIMRELSRLDAVALSQAKTTFVASISHELRSPLHGILGTLEFIKDTPLDSFQTSMFKSLHACGTTLLDTINHVMDYAKISEAEKNVSSKSLKNANTIRLSSKPLKNRLRRDPAFDFSIATEEVVEAVFAGSSYIPGTAKLVEAPLSPSEEYTISFSQRKERFVVLDLAHDDDWVFSFPVGSWRRIVMNLFGNAVKYTDTGYIHISLRSSRLEENSDATTAITLTITDTGSGMSPGFLADGIFQPFSQENPHAPGTGLGLSIVRQIIDTNGGKVEVSSDHQVGTKLSVKLALTKPEDSRISMAERAQYLSLLPRLKGLRICVLRKEIAGPNGNSRTSKSDEGLVRFTNALVYTLETHLKMDVVQTAGWEDRHADIVICPELSFDYLASIRKQRAKGQRAPATVFVGLDALEASSLRSDVRVTNRESVVEIITQPCGPYKMAYVLNRCLDRYNHPAENLQRTSSSSSSPRPLSPENQPQSLSFSRINSLTENLESLNLGSFESAAPSSAGSNTAQASITSPHEEEPVISYKLIVDDNSLNRRLLTAFMMKNGILFEQASNGQEALNMYIEASYKFDVILMDMSMPVMDGMSATRAIRKHEQDNKLPRCSIIALTGLASSSAKLEAWSSGIDHFMTKPVSFKALRELLAGNKTFQDMQKEKT